MGFLLIRNTKKTNQRQTQNLSQIENKRSMQL